jgi:hypothetical protein
VAQKKRARRGPSGTKRRNRKEIQLEVNIVFKGPVSPDHGSQFDSIK